MQTAFGNDPFKIDPESANSGACCEKLLLFRIRGFRIPRGPRFVRQAGREHRLEAKLNLRLGRDHA